MWRLKAWFEKERTHGHEVREKHILTRLRYELELERDQQLVLQEHGDERFCSWALKSSMERLEKLDITQPSKTQESWYEKVVVPRIGATARTGQRLHTESREKSSRRSTH